jgi:hypothetical protein
MTAWTWMRYSYAWDMSVCDDESALRKVCVKYGVYGEIRGTVTKVMSLDGKRHRYAVASDTRCGVRCLFESDGPPCLFFPWKEERSDVGREVALKGRIVNGFFKDLTGYTRYGPVILVRASRFHGGSIIGLAVGAMGCFIFGMYLRRWLRERRSPQRHREH